MTFFETITSEMARGNFSFAILVVGALQLIVMIANLLLLIHFNRKPKQKIFKRRNRE